MQPATTPSTQIQELVAQVFAEVGPVGDQQQERYLREILTTVVRLMRDNASTGDLKLINTALKELRQAFKVFAPYRHVRKVSAFGSARTNETDRAYRQAREFAERICGEGFMMLTGAGGGIMRACQEGSGRERSFGVNIRLPWEQGANEFIDRDPKLITFKYFFTRKLMFIKEADAVVLFPGGFGTLDEGFEALTLAQTGKSHPMPIVFLDVPQGTYWEAWRCYIEEHLVRRDLISPEDMALFKVTTSVDEAVREITTFYRVYHSSRWVGDRFVIRMNRALAPELVETLAREFEPIVLEGGMEQRGPLDEEREQEPELDTLPRLVFAARRGSFGLRRQLIDRLNREG